ncbi:hypothetical protein HGRIS_005291 [Hohenbuehelia grisea]|uniref:Ribosome assembly protein 3 n=1 Tax=Hohenbuehelia grisea TaxID=104357 RepID=A0ABR3JEM0_9AGAR
MAPPPKATKPMRKRNRKRKRRAASTDSSSSSSSSDSDESVALTPKVTSTPIAPEQSSSDESSSSSSSSDSDSDLDDHVTPSHQQPSVEHSAPGAERPRRERGRSPPSRSPSPPSTAIPSFLPASTSSSDNPGDATAAADQEQQLKDRFRKFWMASVAEGFGDDLEKLRKEPNLTTSRLGLLIDSLAAGADVFSSSSASHNGINEMDVVLNQSSP